MLVCQSNDDTDVSYWWCLLFTHDTH